MSPAVLLAENDECLAIPNPCQPGILSLAANRPRSIGFVKDLPHVVSFDIGQQKLTLVTEATEFFNQHLIRVPCPADLSEIEAFSWCLDRQPVNCAD